MNSSTVQTLTSLPTAVYYGDESDEGLVRIFPSDIKITTKKGFIIFIG